ncbi:MAG: thermonuclease family protein [Novosphingobium sp.]|nr:thermonuclease family protein [Novosphingobium sp.]
MIVTLGLAIGALIAQVGWSAFSADASEPSIICSSPRIIDGDTFDCGGTRVRLAGIDSPELPGHCRQGRVCAPGDALASTANLQRLIGGAEVQCRKSDTDRYGRTVARCSAGGRDLSCAQLEGGFTIRRYGYIFCF